SFESNEPQTDSNYITQEEWNQLQERNEELIERYEESRSTGAAAKETAAGSAGAPGFLVSLDQLFVPLLELVPLFLRDIV
ncbi:hypothetical protein EXE53_33300, partial [Halorubrum sp. SD626R]